jgi:erythromycin esterase-like protein
MATRVESAVLEDISRAAHPIGRDKDLDPLIDRIGEARVVLIGEATHGTREFYATRARITRRLIEERGFSAVAVEADWPDASRVNRFVRFGRDDNDANAALSGFRRFPGWMWRNTMVLEFIDWLREWNRGKEAADQAGFYGLDLYSLHASMEAVVDYLDRVDPAAAERARYRYSCFDHFGEDVQSYGYTASFNLSSSCEKEVVAQLVELRRKAAEYAAMDGHVAEDEFFSAEQNARLATNAEQYYRTMFSGRISSWNLRDRHMAETLDALLAHLGRRRDLPRVVVWEHNSHLGDARATEMGSSGEWNVGQLARESYLEDAVNIGFTTWSGTVTAASDWGGVAERKRVRPALQGSYEALLHDVPGADFYLILSSGRTRLLSQPEVEAVRRLRDERLERAIGVIYRPETERVSHYFAARLSDQFDVVIHHDVTEALEPLERTGEWDRGEAPETYPSGL